MQKSKKMRSLARKNTSRRNFLRIERLEDRMVLTGAAPIAVNDSYQLLPDQTLDISAPGILANDTDAEGDVLSAALFAGPAHGSLVLDPAGSFQYTPEAGFTGIDSFMYTAGDGTGHSLLAAVTLRVGGGNSPVSQDDSFTVNEDETLTIPAPAGVLHNDSDADGDPLTAALVTGPANGTVSLAADGSFVYTPTANFHGSDSFIYQASDGTHLGNLATVSITVNSINDKPVADNDAFSLDEDTPLVISGPGVMANDSDADGDPLAASLVSGPLHGSLTLAADGTFTYTPAENFNGIDGFSYLVSDGTSMSSVATVTLEVNAINDKPIAANDEYTTAEDTPLTVDAAAGLIANDSDVDGDSLIASLVSGPAHGTLTLNADGSFVYTPDANFNGVDGFSYVVNDGTVDSDVASVTLNVSAVNDAPVAVNDEYTIDEDTSLTLPAPGILGNDSDVEGDPLAASLVSGPLHGTLSLSADGSLTYTPEANFNGTDGFSYLVNDGSADSEVATVTINVNSIDDPPLAVNDEYTTDEDTPLSVDAVSGLLANDSDPDSSSLTVTMISGPVHGSVTLNADGSFNYTPSADFNGVDGFSYIVSDGTLESDVATVTLNVNAVADAPVAQADSYSTDEDTPLVVDVAGSVLANDTDADGDALTADLVTGPAHGTLTLNSDGSFNYTPEANFNGSDSFVYTANDGTLTSAETTVSITVNPVNDLPLAVADEYSVDEDSPLHVDAAGVLTNDTDPDGDPLSAVLVTGPANGTLTLNADGSFDYAPGANFNGDDSFVYQASDGTGVSADTTVTIHVAAVNDAPVAAADAYTTDEDTPLVVDVAGSVLANDTDADGDALTANLVAGPAHGTLTLNSDGSFNYTPEANFNGSDSFTYKANDGSLDSAETTVSITVGAANDLPLAVADEYSVDEDSTLHVDAAGVITNDSDPDGDPLTAVLVTGPANGTLTLNADGSFDYAPGANFNGDDSFVYQASDGTGTSADTTVTIHVATVNDAPVAAADAYTTDEDTPLVVDVAGSVLANDTDADGDTLTADLVTGPAHGTLTLNADGSFNYTPEANFNGSDSFVYMANDGTLTSAEATVTITVNPANDSPLAVADEYSVDEDSSLHVDATGVLANDTDPDGDPLSAVLVTGPANGTLTLNADGSFDYAPGANFNGDDTFVYQASDGTGTSADTTVTIHVAAVNDAPVAAADAYSTDEDTPLVVDVAGSVLANDTDPDGDPLSAVLVTGPANGTLTLNADGSFDYAPGANFNGDDSFVYQASDGTGTSADTTVTIYVAAVNDTPVAAADSYTTDEDTPLTIAAPGVLANDSDIDGDTLTANLVTGPAHGTLTLNADGSFNYTPEANFNGSDSFTYKASDGSLDSGETTVSITVNPVTDAPLSHNDAYSTGEDVPLTVSAGLGVLANDFDPNGLPLTAELVAGPANGTLTLNADGSFSYTPSANVYGTDSFTYVANNGVEAGPVMTATIVVQPLNDAPVAVDDDVDVDASGSISVAAAEGVLANDSDVDGDALSATLLLGPSHGTLTLNSDGSFSYAAAAGFSGTDSFKYQVSDGMANSNVATVTLHIASQGEIIAPISQDDSYAVNAGTSLTVDAPGVLENDTDAESDPLSATLASGPSHGTLTLNADGSFTYTPDSGFQGTDSFTYTASDGTTTGNVATVTIAVGDPDPNHNPESKDDGYVGTAETLLSVSASEGVLANDSDVDGDPLTAVLVSGAAHGTVTLNPDGSFDYQPEAGFSGDDTFTYQAWDGLDLSEVVTVTITVNPAANQRPVAVNDQFTTTVDQPLSVAAPGLLGNDSDPDGDPQTAVFFSGPQNGTVVLNPDGSFVYTPAAGFEGRDSFIYRTFDGELYSALAAVTIHVNAAPSGASSAIVEENSGNDAPDGGCLLGGAMRSVLHHLELARHGMDEDLLDSLAADQQGGDGGGMNSHFGHGHWKL